MVRTEVNNVFKKALEKSAKKDIIYILTLFVIIWVITSAISIKNDLFKTITFIVAAIIAYLVYERREHMQNKKDERRYKQKIFKLKLSLIENE